jgi:hypothetical protein
MGSFSTTITIPNQEKIYYLRSVAENAGGTVVSRSLGLLKVESRGEDFTKFHVIKVASSLNTSTIDQ